MSKLSQATYMIAKVISILTFNLSNLSNLSDLYRLMVQSWPQLMWTQMLQTCGPPTYQNIFSDSRWFTAQHLPNDYNRPNNNNSGTSLLKLGYIYLYNSSQFILFSGRINQSVCNLIIIIEDVNYFITKFTIRILLIAK